MRIFLYTTPSGRSPVEDFIGKLPKPDQARFRDVFVGVSDLGLDCPRVQFRQLKNKLWEMKFKAASGGYRIAYVVIDGKDMVWLHAFKKTTQKTPATDLKLAEKRMKEVL